jgi:hypothetical protein
MKQLIAARCNLDLQTVDGYTALFIAAATGLHSATQELLEAGCKVGLREKGGRTALQIAQSEGHSRVATLIQNGRKLYTPHTSPTPKPQSCHVDTAERKTEDKEQEKQLVGRLVVINGLLAKPELNGRTGTAMSYDDDKGRYCVKLYQTSTSLMIKPCNLRDDDLGVLLNKWGVTDARTALEANGFNNLERIRDVLDIEDLLVLKLPLATHKMMLKLIQHFAEEKKKQCGHALCHLPGILKCNRCKTVSYCGKG